MGSFYFVPDINRLNSIFFFIYTQHFTDISHSMTENTHKGFHTLIY